MIQYCTVDNYSVSYLSGDGIDGVLLNVTISFGNNRRYIESDKPFKTHDEADSYCLAKGYIQEFKR